MAQIKQCRECKQWKARGIYNFSRARTNKDGYKNICKACDAIYAREWRELKRETIREKKREYHQRPEVKQRKKEYYAVYDQTPKGREVRLRAWNTYARFKRLMKNQGTDEVKGG